MADESDAQRRARDRRASGAMDDFDGERLSLARRLARKQRTALAADIGVSAAAITQFERGQARPTRAIAAKLALALGMPMDFFARGVEIERVPVEAAHFRSLRSTPALSRDRALAFAELGHAVVGVIERYVDFPPLRIQTHPVDGAIGNADISRIAAETRRFLSIPSGPIPHMVRLLESAGVVVLTMPPWIDSRDVDAFSVDTGNRPFVLLSPGKDDRARSRFDAAHELGHLIMHPDVEPGSRIVEEQAHTFASQFLAPDAELLPELPERLDWTRLLRLKDHWKISLKALAFRAHRSGIWTDATYTRASRQLAAEGYPERGDLGPREEPLAIGKAVQLLEEAGYGVEAIARATRLPLVTIQAVVDAGAASRPSLQIV